ncbi:hypothetical protein ACFWPV_12655 [Streptomyces uncialis]|uniref:hypothetical protein n=1 Tax=Streptomyces uncialis TaxID=1048205 RepID=UPI00365D82E9
MDDRAAEFLEGGAARAGSQINGIGDPFQFQAVGPTDGSRSTLAGRRAHPGELPLGGRSRKTRAGVRRPATRSSGYDRVATAPDGPSPAGPCGRKARDRRASGRTRRRECAGPMPAGRTPGSCRSESGCRRAAGRRHP